MLKKGIEVSAPEEHKNVCRIKRFVESGELDVELHEFTGSFDEGTFYWVLKRKKQRVITYRTMPQANREPAQESMEHAKVFFKNIFKLRNELKEQ